MPARRCTVLGVRQEPDWSDDYLAESAYLVERGVRAMAIVDHVEANAQTMLEVATRLEIATVGAAVIPFVIDRGDGMADCGFATAKWVVDLYEWLVKSDTPKEHAHRIRGLLLGYSVDAIRAHYERGCGRRFTSLPERASR